MQGGFYPFHRLFLHAWEKALNTCGWTEGLPYWDWLKDYGTDDDFLNSPIFDVETGMGGNGAWVPGNFTHPEEGFPVNAPWDMPDRTGGDCIHTGPFVNFSSSFGPHNFVGYNPNPDCLRRDFSPESFRGLTNPESIALGMSQPDFGWFSITSEPTFHAGGHMGIGGLYGHMTDKWASRKFTYRQRPAKRAPSHNTLIRMLTNPTAADPLFWLHHGNVDRAWWSWQQRDLENRVNDISGPLINFDYANEFGGNATLDDIIYVGETVRLETTIRDVMHIQKGPLCYVYDELY